MQTILQTSALCELGEGLVLGSCMLDEKDGERHAQHCRRPLLMGQQLDCLKGVGGLDSASASTGICRLDANIGKIEHR